MAALTTAFTILLILVNLIGLALAMQRLMGSYALSRVASPALVALVLFFAEHFVGLGRLAWCWPLTTAGAVWQMIRHRETLWRLWRVEAAFLIGFEWAFLWRLSFPGIVASSEKIGDLAMIASYLPGDRLPPTDVWYPPYPFDVYYSFQQYAASLLARIFNLEAGLAYNLAFCLLAGLTTLAAGWFTYLICRRTSRAVLVTLAFVVGGTGVSLPVHFMMTAPQLHSSMRFVGDAALSEQMDTRIGRAVAAWARPAAGEAIRLPAETYGYLVQLGDYHSPLSGFYLLALGLLCIGLIETGLSPREPQAVLAATPMLCTISNGWSLPLQLALVVTWIAHRRRGRGGVDWLALGGGFLLAATLCYPFLSTYAYRTADYGLRLRLVRAGEQGPWLLVSLVLYPTVLAALLPLVLGERRRWPVWSSILWLLLLAFSLLFYVDDVYSGSYNRFNTTLKWWPWIQAAALLTAGAYGMASRSKALRYSLATVLVVVSTYGVDLGRHLIATPKSDFGKLDGMAAVTSDPIERALLAYLRAQPRGIVLQRPETGAFTPAPALVLFAGQQAFLGWAAHERLWRGQRTDVDLREKEVAAFYAGEMPEPLQWLLVNRIDHVLWLKTEMKQPAAAFGRINDAIGPAFYWHEFYRAGDFRVGVWTRVPFNTGPRSVPRAALP